MELPKERYFRKQRAKLAPARVGRAVFGSVNESVTVQGLGTATGTITGQLDFAAAPKPSTPTLRGRMKQLLDRLTFTHGGERWTFDLLAPWGFGDRTSVWVGCAND